MLLHAIHLPDVFAVAKSLLPPTDLGLPGEAAHACLWRHVCDHYERTGHVPDYEVLLADVERDLRKSGRSSRIRSAGKKTRWIS